MPSLRARMRQYMGAQSVDLAIASEPGQMEIELCTQVSQRWHAALPVVGTAFDLLVETFGVYVISVDQAREQHACQECKLE